MRPDTQSLLRIHPAACGLSEDEIREITQFAKVTTYSPGKTILHRDDVPDSIFLVIGGRFGMVVSDGNNWRIANFGPGDQIGFLFVLHEEKSSVDVVADEPSMTIEIDQASLFQLMRDLPLFAKNLLKSVTSGINDLIVRQKLYAQPRTVTFLHTCPDTRGVVRRVQKRLEQIGETVGLVTDDQSQSATDRVVIAKIHEDAESEAHIRQRIADWASLDRILFDVDLQTNDLRWENLARLYSFSQQLFIVVSPDTALGQTQQIADSNPDSGSRPCTWRRGDPPQKRRR